MGSSRAAGRDGISRLPRTQGPAEAGWRTAGALVLIAVAGPLTPVYAAQDGTCGGGLPILGA
ncbi:hypothetical protein Ssi03_27100 [Sphaerisporangium siamense]|nr:hypothetical protein Ssi03_27100 [Sphaerisporangium siamense]